MNPIVLNSYVRVKDDPELYRVTNIKYGTTSDDYFLRRVLPSGELSDLKYARKLEELTFVSNERPTSVSVLGKDAINPNHYTAGGIEVIDYLEAKLGVDGTVAYCLGNVIKYASRAGKKLHAAEDCRKASWYCLKAAELFDKKGAPREG